MKIWEVFTESPTDLGKSADPFIFSIDESYISVSSLNRSFSHLGKLTVDGTEYDFWLGNNNTRSMITTIIPDSGVPIPIATDASGNRKHLIVTDLIFGSSTLPINNAIQLSSVSTNSNYRDRGFATILYIVLARYGFNVVSDYSQYTGGIMLWKKLARESIIRNYVVRIWDTIIDGWIVDEKNEPVKYDEQNLAHDVIWSKIGTRPNTVLVLSSN